jgi:hypothetical protein
MPDFGPTGGPGGSPCEDVAPAGTRIAGLIINSDGSRNVVIGIQVFYVNTTNGEVTFGDQHGGVAGGRETIPLHAGEFFTQISGRTGQFVNSLTVETSKPRRFRFGGLDGTRPSSTETAIPPNRLYLMAKKDLLASPSLASI